MLLEHHISYGWCHSLGTWNETHNQKYDACWKYGSPNDLLSDKFWIYFLELLNFKKADLALVTELDKWLYALKHMSKLEEIPVCLQEPIFIKLFNIAEYANLTKEEQMSYDQELKYKWDNENALAYREEQGLEKGKKEVARELKDMGLPLTQIVKATKLPIEEIEAL